MRGDLEREAFLRAWSAGRRPEGVPPEVTAIIDRNAQVALVLDAFHRRLLMESKRTLFPAAEIARARPEIF